MEKELIKSRENAEKKIGFELLEKDAQEILEYTKRKLKVIKKEDDYLPILYEQTIVDTVTRRVFNYIREERKSKIQVVADGKNCIANI